MKIELEKNTTVHDGEQTFGPGGIHEIRDDLAHTLLETGSAFMPDILAHRITPTA